MKVSLPRLMEKIRGELVTVVIPQQQGLLHLTTPQEGYKKLAKGGHGRVSDDGVF